jgi:hypothetical protein
MSLRKVVALLAGFALAAGLLGSGIGAQFTDQVTAQEHINVGTFSCQISDATNGAVIAPDHKSVSYTAPTIMSSAPDSAPFSFTVKNDGAIADVLTVATSPAISSPWSIIGAPFAPVALSTGDIHTYDTGIAWTELSNTNLAQSGTVTWTVTCAENLPAAIFDNTPSVLPSNLPSWGAEAYYFDEWGAGVTFAGTARKLGTATVIMSSWACETGNWTDGSCVTTPGHTYNVPIRFNIYNVGPSNSVGSVIATETHTFAIPYRPSADATHCTASDAGKWFDGAVCKNGLANKITFTFSGQTLPNSVIFGIAYNTSTNGYTPEGPGNHPEDSLNIATYPGTDMNGGTEVAPVLGTWVPNGLSVYGARSAADGGTGVFAGPVTTVSSDMGPFGSLMPAVQIKATN